MANVSSITTPNGTSYDLKDKSAVSSVSIKTDKSITYTKRDGTSTTISPTAIAEKTYTGLLGSSSNNAANDSWYFMGVRPTSFDAQWSIRYTVEVTIPGQTDYHESSDMTLFGLGGAAAPLYTVTNTIRSTSYRPYYFHNFYRLTAAGYSAGLSNAIGLGLRSSTERATTGYERTAVVRILECNNCVASLLDTPVKWASWTSGTTTNYAGLTEYNGTISGQVSSGVPTTNTYDREFLASFNPTAGANGVVQYGLFMQKTDETYESIVTTSGTGTTKTKNTSGFRTDKLFYYSGSSSRASGVALGASTVYTTCPIDARYSFNCGQTLTAHKPFYLVGTLDSNGLYYLSDPWYSQTLPTTADGKYYMYVGETYNTYCIDLCNNHPMFYYINGRVRQWTDTVILQAEVTNAPIVETQVEEPATYATGATTITISHAKAGYTCHLIGCPQYEIGEGFFVYILNTLPNQAQLYIRNSGSSITGSIGETTWLCVPNS